MAQQGNQDFSCVENKVLELLLEIAHVQWFAIKTDCRKLVTEGRLQLIKASQKLANEVKQKKPINEHTKSTNHLILHDMLILMFVDNNNYQYEIDKSLPILKVSDRNYIFPSLQDFFGLVIDFRINPEILFQFEELLKKYGKIKTSSKILKIHDLPYNEAIQIGPSDIVAETGNKIAHCICKRTILLTSGIRRGSTFAMQGIQKGRDKLKEHIKQEEEMQINPQVHANLIKAQLATKAMAAVSGAVVTGAVAAANAFSNGLSDSLSKTEVGQKLIVNEGPKIKAAKDIVKSTVASYSTVYEEIVQAGLAIIRETGSAIAHVVEHKYGTDAGRAARCAAEVVDDAAFAAVNVSRLSTASLTKQIVKNTTVDILSNEEEKKNNRLSRVSIDPLTGLQVMSVVGQLGNISQEVANQNRLQRHQYIGMNESNLNNEFILQRDSENLFMNLQNQQNNMNNSKPNYCSKTESELLKLDLD